MRPVEHGRLVAGAPPEQRSVAAGRRLTPRALLGSLRPRQWLKNLLVAAVPAAAGELGDLEVLAQTGLAFVAFCFASSAAYLLNDIIDQEADRRHPVKRERPIAAGALSVSTAALAAAVTAAAALGAAAAASLELLAGVAAYLALTTAYSRWLKHEPVFDIATLAAGFFLRTVAGGLATGIHVSSWFAIVAAGGSMFVVAGKRYAEARRAGPGSGTTRRVLASYSANYLEAILTLAASVTVLAYCLWALEDSGELASGWRGASVVPFVLALMRYGLLVDQGRGEEPEEIFLRDRTLQLITVCWAVLLAAGVLA
jgi:decaprenyl-phosphate phosphoribosyltransferase